MREAERQKEEAINYAQTVMQQSKHKKVRFNNLEVIILMN